MSFCLFKTFIAFNFTSIEYGHKCTIIYWLLDTGNGTSFKSIQFVEDCILIPLTNDEVAVYWVTDHGYSKNVA